MGYVIPLKKGKRLMYKHFICALAVLISMILPCCTSQAEQTAKSAVISLPAGEILSTIVTTPLNSEFVSLGQVATTVFTEDLYYGGKLIIPADSVVRGNVISVSPASKFKHGEIVLRFNNIVTPYGIQIPISAIVNTGDKRGKISGTGQYESETHDGNVDIPISMPLELLLIQPITVNPELYNSNY